MQFKEGRFVLERPAYDEGTPLYNLAALAALPQATVLLVEGEVCADALARFIDTVPGLGECYVVSTTGGAASPHKADLRPLAGRNILIWPDRDSPGERHAEALTKRLEPVAAALAEIDAAALGLPEGGDCVDWLAAHPRAALKDFLTLPRRKRTPRPSINQQDKKAEENGADEAWPSLIVERAEDIEMKPIRWLWRNVAARGKITMLVGNPDLGKSTVLLYITATLTRGCRFPLQSEPVAPGNVVLFSAEDDVGDTAKPRLTAMGADMTRVHFVKGVRDVDRKDRLVRRPVSLMGDLALLAGELRRIGEVKALIVDPITAYLEGIDSHKNAEVRSVLFALEELAQEFDCAILAMNHLTKSAVAAGEPLLRVLGSLAFVAGPRLVHAVVRDPNDRARRLLLPLKNNIGPKGQGYAFRFEKVELGQGVEGSRLVWESAPRRTRHRGGVRRQGGAGGREEQRARRGNQYVQGTLGRRPSGFR